jgi:hypothetical protein
MDNDMVLAIRSARIPPDEEATLVALIEAYGRERYQAGYNLGIAVAKSNRP